MGFMLYVIFKMLILFRETVTRRPDTWVESDCLYREFLRQRHKSKHFGHLKQGITEIWLEVSSMWGEAISKAWCGEASILGLFI